MVYGYDVETKIQSSQWTSKTSPDPKMLANSIQNQGAAHSFFFDVSGVVHHEYLPESSTVNQTYYIEVLKRLRDAIRRGGVVTGFSIMTTLQPIQPSELVSFWPNIPSLFFPTPLTHVTLLQVVSFCSPCSKYL